MLLQQTEISLSTIFHLFCSSSATTDRTICTALMSTTGKNKNTSLMLKMEVILDKDSHFMEESARSYGKRGFRCLRF